MGLWQCVVGSGDARGDFLEKLKGLTFLNEMEELLSDKANFFLREMGRNVTPRRNQAEGCSMARETRADGGISRQLLESEEEPLDWPDMRLR